ncbi:lipase family protein [Streptomyces sp. ME18-1-4]|uniref:lipase family protein n=1 Tax=Streptomyces sp. ME18-1-4 TaxID=3028685 RepID=UPI0029A2015D|nr:lipase family protein [Streptomyces sp. ME18-1-4]MDX3248341.1 lipase family protein [Streptomyces sp. ME18-1-4]
MSAPTPLDHSASGYSVIHAYWLAQAARAAYKSPKEAEGLAREWGFDRFRHFSSPHTMPFPIDDTQAYVAGSDRMVLVAFRGTEPTNLRDWLSDANTPPVPGPAKKGFVHYGFHRALDVVHPQVRDTIAEFKDDGQTVWFTGHSLGGALAMLSGARMHFEAPNLMPHGVYTYGQPRTCDAVLAKAYDQALKGRTFRFVNNNDIVPQVPPAPAFQHVETVRYIDAAGKLHDRMPALGLLADRVKGATADLLAPASDGVRDHFIDHYVAGLEKNLA